MARLHLPRPLRIVRAAPAVLLVLPIPQRVKRPLPARSRDIQALAALQVEIEEQRRTVERFKETTWGVVLHEEKDGRKFVVLPTGSLKDPPWTLGERPAVLLSSE